MNTDFAVVQQIADLSAEGVVIYDLHSKKLVYSNRIASELLGVHTGTPQPDMEAIFAKIIPEDRDYVRSKLSTVATQSITGEVEFRIAADGGNNVWLCFNAYLVANDSAIIISVRDISKSKAWEQYLVEYGARKNTMLDTLTHHISGALNLMRHLATEAEKHIESSSSKNLRIYLNLLNANNTHCLEIIHDLLKNEHVESPGVFIKKTRIDIIARVSIIHEELQQSFTDRTFVYDHSVDSLFINTDEIKLLQVVNNFTSNAIKFSPHGKPIRIAIAAQGEEVVLSVTDQGIGIPPALQPGIFQHQVGIGRTGLNGEKSIGLGLFICKNLAELMGGKVWFESKEHAGSTFYLSLPRV